MAQRRQREQRTGRWGADDNRWFRRVFSLARLRGNPGIDARDLSWLRVFALNLFADLARQGRRGRNVLSLGLSMPDSERWRVEEFVRIYAASFAVADDEGALIWIETSESGQEHAHGLAITRHEVAAVSKRWACLTGGVEAYVLPLRGSERPWHPRNRMLATNLSRVVKYPSKQPDAWSGQSDPEANRSRKPALARHRARGAGFVAWHWARVAARKIEPLSGAQAVQGVARCTECGGPTLPTRRRCSAACRTAATRRRQRYGLNDEMGAVFVFLSDTATFDPYASSGGFRTPSDPRVAGWARDLTHDARERFEERAGIIEDGLPPGCSEPRARAEWLAFEQLSPRLPLRPDGADAQRNRLRRRQAQHGARPV